METTTTTNTATAGDIGSAKKDVEAVAAATPVQTEEKKAVTVEDVADDDENVPDPDEDDLDDLDDMLDEFSSVNINAQKPAGATAPVSGPGRPPAATDATGASGEDTLDEDEFAKQLQAGMADLLGEIESSPEMQAQFESIFKELGAAAASSSTAAPDSSSSTTVPPPPFPIPSIPNIPGSTTGSRPGTSSGEASFQETIRKTMERMQAGGDQATAAAAAEGSDDFLAELLKQMQSGGGLGDAAGGLGGEGGEEEFSKMLMGMMEQLTNKEILYEPMKELHERFPEWLVKNREKTSVEDLKRYEEQQALVKEIVAKFEEKSYSDSNAADREYIVDRMQKMQACGQPPSDLVGEMPTTQDALGMPDEGCTPQ
ncbi:Pex19 protein family-domain-containing protein [Podospora australis]|uniref:Pex19 protein family-domain-containing protein n=1 Tax=Podospora australis TaxID=1536484 RepID=A0AAN7AMF1_9PEZI|nr:Pex19 protein family-domain-containing protein [Podospora australis]